MMLYTGTPVSGNEALAIGLVNAISRPGEALEEARKLAKLLLLERLPTG
jgi:enoyl-CoA hydratase/carnithine racemase